MKKDMRYIITNLGSLFIDHCSFSFERNEQCYDRRLITVCGVVKEILKSRLPTSPAGMTPQLPD
jgi:hypothetical protein